MVMTVQSTIHSPSKLRDFPLRLLHTPILTATQNHTSPDSRILVSFRWPWTAIHPGLRLPNKFSNQVVDVERVNEYHRHVLPSYKSKRKKFSLQFSLQRCSSSVRRTHKLVSDVLHACNVPIFGGELKGFSVSLSPRADEFSSHLLVEEDEALLERRSDCISGLCSGAIFWLASAQFALASEDTRINEVYEMGELFELGIQLTYLLLLLALLGIGSFFVIRQVLVRRELDLSAKELQEQVRSGDASATELFELGAVMLRRKFYPAATKYLLQAIEKWDGDDQDLAQVYNALGVSYMRDEKVDKGIAQFEKAVKLQPGYVTAWNNLGDAYEKKNDFKSALKAFEEALLFDPNNKIARPRRDAVKNKVKVYKGVPVKSSKKS